MTQLNKLTLPDGVAKYLPKNSIIRKLAEERPTNFGKRIEAVAKRRVEQRIVSSFDTLKRDGALGVLKK